MATARPQTRIDNRILAPKKRRRRLDRGQKLGYLFILPSLIMLALVLGLPAVVAVLNSVKPLWEGDGGFTLHYYEKLLQDRIFWNSLGSTIIFVGGTVILHLLIGLVVALALNTEIRARRLWRVLIILPWTVPDVIAGLLWRSVYHPTAGVLNPLLVDLGLSNNPYIEWLGTPQLAMSSVIMADVWRGYPFVMLILLAGLQAIPRELYEAGEVDGATPWQAFRFITLPSLRQMILIAMVLDIIWQSRRFGLVYTLTQGGPARATNILPMHIYDQYFRFFDFEYASATAVVMAVIMLIISLPYIRAITRKG